MLLVIWNKKKLFVFEFVDFKIDIINFFKKIDKSKKKLKNRISNVLLVIWGVIWKNSKIKNNFLCLWIFKLKKWICIV